MNEFIELTSTYTREVVYVKHSSIDSVGIASDGSVSLGVNGENILVIEPLDYVIDMIKEKNGEL